MADLLPLPEGLARDTATWEHTLLVVQHLVVQFLALLQQQTARIQALEACLADLEARVQQRAHQADRPPSADPPYAQQPTWAGPHGQPGATPGHPGHQQALVAPTEVIEGKPSACTCGQTTGRATSPYATHQGIALPEIQMRGRHVVWYEASWPQGGQVTKAQVPPEAAVGQGPRLTALIGARSGNQRGRRRAVQACCPSVLGIHLSRGAIPGAVERVSEALAPVYEAIAAKARQAPVHYLDETSWYQHGVLAWWWVMVHTTVAVFKVPAHRNTAAFAALMKRWAGSLVSAGDGVYGQWV